ncbi:MAG: VacJ family lipoprotein [Sulfurospirillaceae bacterium]|nr:VacJ family lipoprotein [Sulfurospirillaceae bacterium]MDD2827551.1 VacJ family lipoprotein [Sulfurospirillaceae bacterium]
MRIFFIILLSFNFLLAADYFETAPYVSTSSLGNDDFEKEFNDPKKENIIDPLSGYNIIMTNINDKFYEYLLKPTAQGYAYIVPENARNGIGNFFDNLFFPIRFVNNLLQFKIQNSIDELERFTINSTMGIAGFADVAYSTFNIKSHQEDFGQTLGFYGVGSGFHVVLPLFGSSNLRDIAGLLADAWIDPLNYIAARDINILKNSEQSLYLTGFYTINKTSLHIEEYDNFKKDAIELYPYLRSFYESRRTKLISE